MWENFKQFMGISIHALREESDGNSSDRYSTGNHFYPRPPRGERPSPPPSSLLPIAPFLSTPSARRATLMMDWMPCPALFLSTPSARRATRQTESSHTCPDHNFYPRPPRGERPTSGGKSMPEVAFLSTPSARRATMSFITLSFLCLIFLSTPSARRATFYKNSERFLFILFLSTPSARRATSGVEPRPHLLYLFLSTPSARRATQLVLDFAGIVDISIHALREESDGAFVRANTRRSGFLSTPSARRATRTAATILSSGWHFYPRPPRGERRCGPSRCPAES